LINTNTIVICVVVDDLQRNKNISDENKVYIYMNFEKLHMHATLCFLFTFWVRIWSSFTSCGCNHKFDYNHKYI